MPRGIPNKKQKLHNVQSPLPTYTGYEQLKAVLTDALDQAAVGKGRERHAQDKPFHVQPMQQISELINSSDGMRYQAMKKLQESGRMEKDPAIRELLGVIVYTAGLVIYLNNQK